MHALACGLTTIALLTAASLARAEVLIDTDFGTAAEPIVGRGDTPNERVTGVMAGEWRDDSVWSENVRATWTRMEEEGRAFVRLEATKVLPDRYQLAHVLPKIEGETFYRLTLTARSVPGASVQIGVRDSGPPYQFHWEKRIQLTADWREHREDFRLTKLEQDVGFWINLGAEGQLDLHRLQLARLSRDDYVEELKRKYPDGGPRNLVRNSRFPLGLQSGWALGRDNSDGDDVVIGPDADERGPSGYPALRVEMDESTTIWSEPFGVPLAFQTHVASLHVKGGGEVRLTVLRDGRQLAQKTFEGKPEWQRLHVAFEPALMAQSYVLQIIATQTFWMDALQVAPGKEPTPYAAQLPCEVALACPKSDASVAGVQFDDEPAEVEFAITGDTQGSTLRAKLVDVYGGEHDLSVPDGDVSRGRLQFQGVSNARYGPFRLETWVEDADGNRISPFNEVIVNRLPRPRYWGKDAPDSPFGVHTNSTTRHNVMAKAIGINWTRLHDAGLQYLGWWFLEREQGQWTFRDKEIHRYRRDHLKILGEVGTAPEWASYFPGKAHSGYFDRYYQPKRMEDYANYVRTVAERYKGVIDAYDVWNEPWIYAWWGIGYDETKSDRAGYVTSERPQADFVRLSKTAYETVKSIDPSATVLGFNSTTGGGGATSISGSEWTRGVLEAGGMDHCDAVCYHCYIGGKPGYPGDVCEEGFGNATGAIQERFGKNPKPVWMTEGSAARDTIGPGFYNHTLPHPNPEDVIETADRLCRYIVSLLAQGVDKLFLYSMHAQGPLFHKPGGWRCLVTPEGQLHPSGVAHGILAWHLEDTQFVEVIEVADGVFAYVFEAKDKSRSVAVISGKPGHAEYRLASKQGVEVSDLFGNAVANGKALGDRISYVSVRGPVERLNDALR